MFLEHMEQIDYDTGETSSAPSSDTVGGKMLIPQGGRGSSWWNTGNWPRSPWGDSDPRMPNPEPTPEDFFGAPGDDHHGASMMSVGYDDPSTGLGNSVGAFVGIGQMTAICDIPNEIQPGVPGGRPRWWSVRLDIIKHNIFNLIDRYPV